MNVAFGEPKIAVDTHVFRVANRTKYATGKTPEQVQIKMERYTPLEYRVMLITGLFFSAATSAKPELPNAGAVRLKTSANIKKSFLKNQRRKKVKQMKPGT